MSLPLTPAELEASHVIRQALPESLHSPALARSAVRAALAECPPDTVDVAELLVSELATNAVVHGRSMLVLGVEVVDALIRVSVEDCSSDNPEPRQLEWFDDSVGGRGLVLVDALAAAWGWERTSTGKRVWFELS